MKVNGIYGPDTYTARWHKNRARMLMYVLERYRDALTPEQQNRLDQAKSKIKETGLVDFDYNKNSEDFDRFDNPFYRRGR